MSKTVKPSKLTTLFAVFFLVSSCEFLDSQEQGGAGRAAETGVALFNEDQCCRDSSYCQDGEWCNGYELCNCWGECIPGNPPDCSSDNICDEGSCNEGLDMCEYIPIPNCCITVEDCRDGNPCTLEDCVDNQCEYTALAEGTACDADTFECTLDECRGGSCFHGIDVGAPCRFTGDACYNPGECLADGLCGPGALHPPGNDTCDAAVAMTLSDIGYCCQISSTACATNTAQGFCGGAGNPDVFYVLQFAVSPSLYQLYSYNFTLNAEFNSIMHIRRDCPDPNTEVGCNDDCVSNPILNCGFYDLDATDSAVTVQPQPAGTNQSFYVAVDGRGGARGDFKLEVQKVIHANNPCKTWRDNIKVVDATDKGTYRGNINGYVNDLIVSGVWLKTPSHSGATASFDWPARAWFKLQPDVATAYTIWTDEVTPATYFDSVIGVWDNSLVRGCDGTKTYISSAHIAGRNSRTEVNVLVPAGKTYLVGISSYDRPVSGNYVVHFD
ncbi:MAG: hypothetical protein ABIJ56_02555 [Pseudomonadota bacterium]